MSKKMLFRTSVQTTEMFHYYSGKFSLYTLETKFCSLESVDYGFGGYGISEVDNK